MRIFVGIFAALVALLGCATPQIESRVSVFHDLPTAPPADATFVVLPWRDEMKGSLEFAAYAREVATRLQSKGFLAVTSANPAKYAVFVDFGIDDGRTETRTYSVPQYGVTGYSSSTTSGTITQLGNTAFLNATTTTTPTYGVTGTNQVTQSAQVFRRFLKVDVVELGLSDEVGKKVYEGQLRSEGTCGNLPSVIPVLLQALLDDFPGRSGEARTVSLPWTGSC